MLDSYFSLRTSPLTLQRIAVIQHKMNLMSTHFISVYQLMQVFNGKPADSLPHSRKLHAAVCNICPYLQDFGVMDLADTASYESIHRKFTVAAWGKTSKRLESMNEEMAAQCLLMNYTPFNEFIHAVSTDTMAKYIATRGPVTAPDHIVMRSLPNLKSYELSVGLVTQHIEGPAQYVDMLDSAGTTAETLTILVRESFGQAAWDTLQKIHHPTSLRILHGLTIEGN
jgi:hypothetical protein